MSVRPLMTAGVNHNLPTSLAEKLEGRRKRRASKAQQGKSPGFASKITMSPRPLAKNTQCQTGPHTTTHIQIKMCYGGGLWLLLKRDAGPRMSLVTKKRYMRGGMT